MADMVGLIEQLADIAKQNKQLLTELRQERKAMKAAIKEAAEATDNLKEWTEYVKNAAHNAVDEEVSKELKDLILSITEKVDRIAESKANQVGDTINRLINLYLYGHEQPRGTDIFTQIDEVRKGLRTHIE